MRLDLAPDKLRSLPVQVIELADGLVLKRGRVEVEIRGQGVAEIVRAVFDAAGGEGIAEEDLLAGFPEPERQDVAALVRHLLARRLLVRGNDLSLLDPVESPSSVFYWHFGRSGDEVAGRLGEQVVLIVGVNQISRQLAGSLVACGFEGVEVLDDPLLQNHALYDDQGALDERAWPAPLPKPRPLRSIDRDVDPEGFDCLVATSDFGAVSLLRPWNEFCHLHGRSFLPVVLRDMVGRVGPLVVPGETACLECLRLRERTHQTDPYVRRVIEDASPAGAPAGFLPPMASSLGDVAAVELIKFFGLGAPLGKAGLLIEVNLLAPEVTARKVLRMPRCPVCTPLNERPSVSALKSGAAVVGVAP